MGLHRIRPRFDVALPCAPDAALDRVRADLDRPGCPCRGRIVGTHVELAVLPDDRHFWSPCLHMEFREDAAGTTVHGLIGPHPNLWTMFAFLYGSLVCVVFFGLMLGFAQMMIDRATWGLWVAGAAVLTMGVLYVISQVGQRLAHEQMDLLRVFAAEALQTRGSEFTTEGHEGPRRGIQGGTRQP